MVTLRYWFMSSWPKACSTSVKEQAHTSHFSASPSGWRHNQNFSPCTLSNLWCRFLTTCFLTLFLIFFSILLQFWAPLIRLTMLCSQNKSIWQNCIPIVIPRDPIIFRNLARLKVLKQTSDIMKHCCGKSSSYCYPAFLQKKKFSEVLLMHHQHCCDDHWITSGTLSQNTLPR